MARITNSLRKFLAVRLVFFLLLPSPKGVLRTAFPAPARMNLSGWRLLLILMMAGGCLLPSDVRSQQWIMPVDGKVMVGVQKAAGAVITLYKNGQQHQQVVTTSNGKFGFELIPNAEFIISVTKPGYITKKFKIVTANVPADRAEGGNFNPFQPDVTLFEMPTAPEIAKRVEAILSQPIAIYQYIPSEKNFNYDEKYTESIQQKLSELADLQKQVEKQMEDKAKNAAAEAQKQLELDNKYKTAITKGDGQFGAKDYAAAKAAYTEANTIKPSEQYPKTKLAEIEKLLADESKKKELEEKYKAAIEKADGAFSSKNYASAKTSYTEASYLKPAEQYPKTKIAEIDKLLADAGKQKEIDEKYKAAITKGDGAFNSKEYASAKTSFTDASGIKPSEQYPKTKLAELDKLLADANKQKEIDAKYQAAITKGDNAFKTKDYSAAKAGFTEASAIKPAETYPKQMLSEIDKILADAASAAKQKEIDEKYKAAITKGDEAFNSKDYTTARAGYTEASQIKPAEQYSKTKLAEIDKLLGSAEAEKQKEQQYKDAIAKADAAFGTKEYVGAKNSYTQASTLKPSEKYPKDKIVEIDKILAGIEAQKSAAAKQKEMDEKYKAAIAKGDGAFGTKNYTTARAGYSEASQIKPAEQYPKQKIAEIDKLLADLASQKSVAEKDKQYNNAIARGDKLFSTKFYDDARSAYNDALGVKPAEQYPKDKIAEIDKLLADLASKNASDKNYLAAVTRGDYAFNGKTYANAKAAYSEALTYKPNEQYPKDRLAEIEKIEKDRVASQAQQEKDLKYNQAIGKGDDLFKFKNYLPAKGSYEEALTYKPLEQYPRDRIKLIEDIIKKSQAAQNIKKEPKQTVPVVSEEEKKKIYQSELRSKYPNGITEEEFTDNGKTILRRVVIKDDFAGVYMKITHNWGGIYCFRDNVPITEITFENETK